MSEAVIVATGRTPIGRAMKGSLVDCRPDDLTALVVKTVLEKLPQLDPQTVEDVIIGCARPYGEAGYNLGRVAGILAGHDIPGTTVNRYCASSLQAIRMAAHAIRAGEGEVFVAGGVECVSHYDNDARPGAQSALRRAEARTGPGCGGRRAVDAAGGPPGHVHHHGPDGGERGRVRAVSRQEMDEFRPVVPGAGRGGAGERLLRREIIPVTTPDGTVVTKDDCPRPATTIERLCPLKPVFRPRVARSPPETPARSTTVRRPWS